MTAAIRAEKNGVELYDYAITRLEGELAKRRSWESKVALENRVFEHECALLRLRNLREMFITEEFEYMLERAPLKQGDVRDGVVK